MPFFVRTKSFSPIPSSFRRRRAMFTVRVFSSTKLSVYQSFRIRVSRETVEPLCSRRTWRIRYSFRVSSSRCPS